jgi:hypothetical protein
MIDPESRRVLDLARAARTPSQANKAAVERRLATALGVWAGAGAATAAAASSSTLGASKLGASKLAASGALKWWLGGVALLGAGATYVALSAAPARESVGVVQKRVPPAAIETVSAQPMQAAPAVAKSAPVPAEQTSEVQARSARPMPARALARNERPRAAAHTAKAGELDLLHRAQAAWRAGQPRNALGLLDQHRKRFPRSALRVERDGLRALTLCELGRSSEARELARQVLAREPRSPLRAALEQSCAL